MASALALVDASTVGNRAILERPLVALFCSTRVPPMLLLPSYDLIVAMRDAGVPTISGFQSRIEQDALGFLLKGEQPVVISPARSIERMRVPAAWRPGIAAGRLLVVSPFPPAERRATTALAEARNRFVLGLAAAALVLHAATGGRVAALCAGIATSGMPWFTLDHPTNAPLVALGAKPVRPATVAEEWAAVSSDR